MNQKGFTLIEMIITIVLLAIVGTFITINFVGLNNKRDTKEQVRSKNIITTAVDAYIRVEDIDVNDSKTIEVRTLVNEGYLTEKLIGDYTNYKVVVTKTNDKSYVYELEKD